MHTFTNCIMVDGGYPTQDGYIRVLTKPRKEGGKLKMLHRIEWEKVHGPIPAGYTIDHRCKNRKCQNVNHMQLLSRTAHARKDNAERYLIQAVQTLKWLSKNSGLKPKTAAEKFGVKRSYIEELSRRYPDARQHLDMQKFTRR